MALSAASPCYRGYVSDIDCRWGVISASVDDRTREERGLEPLKNNNYRISKSRYDSIDSYLSECGEKYNDIDLTIDKEIYEQLLQEGEQPLLFSRFDCTLLVIQSSLELVADFWSGFYF